MTLRAGGIADINDFVPGVGLGRPLYIVKAAAETVTNSTTMQDDDDLQFSLVAGRLYRVDFVLSVQSASATPDIKTEWSVPASTSGVKHCIGPAATSSTGWVGREDTNARFSVHGFATVVTYQLDTAGSSIWEHAVLESPTDGLLKLRWAQQLASTTATQMNQQSYLLVTALE